MQAVEFALPVCVLLEHTIFAFPKEKILTRKPHAHHLHTLKHSKRFRCVIPYIIPVYFTHGK